MRKSLLLTFAGLAFALSLAAASSNAQGYAYVANTGCSFTGCVPSNTVSVINILDNTVVANIQVGSVPYEIAFTPDGNRAYVTNALSNSVSVIDVLSATVSATIPVGTSPIGIAINPDGTRAYVVSQIGYIWIIDTNPSDSATYNQVVATVGSVGNTPTNLAITPDGKKVYVVVSYSDQVSVIDTTTNTVIATIGDVGSNPQAVAITPDGTHAYVTSYGSGFVSVIDTSTNSVITTIGIGGSPMLIAITPDGTRAYVGNEGSTSVAVIDTSTNTVVGAVEMGSTTCGVAFTPDGNHAYVTTWPYSVSVVDSNPSDPGYNTVVGTITVGNAPFGITIKPVALYSATVQQPINVDGSSVFNAKRGVVPVKFSLTYSGTATCQLPPATISLARTTGQAQGPIDESVYLLPSDIGSNFRIDSCQYIYNLATGMLGTGNYVVKIWINGRVAGTATFGLR